MILVNTPAARGHRQCIEAILHVKCWCLTSVNLDCKYYRAQVAFDWKRSVANLFGSLLGCQLLGSSRSIQHRLNPAFSPAWLASPTQGAPSHECHSSEAAATDAVSSPESSLGSELPRAEQCHGDGRADGSELPAVLWPRSLAFSSASSHAGRPQNLLTWTQQAIK